MKRLYTLLFICACVSQVSAQIKVSNGFSSYEEGATTDFTDFHIERRAMPICYTDETEAGRMRRVGSQMSAPLKAFGSPKAPVILVQFDDKRFISGLAEGDSCKSAEDETMVNTFYGKFFNGTNDTEYWTGSGSYGAIRDYFRDQSNGQFTPEFVIIGPVTLPKSYAYYGKDNGSSKDVKVGEFYSEAITKAQALISSWDEFDNDSNGSVDMAFFVYAGEGQNGSTDTNTIWPHERQSGGTYNGVKYGCYACSNETYKGKTDGVGVYLHELGHALGLPDFYDTNYVAYGLDYWDLMDSGCYNNTGYTPCGYSTYEKDFMGWQPLVELDFDTPQHLVLQPVHDGGSGYKIVNPNNSDEYFIIENRQPAKWDSFIGRGTARTKMHGMMVTHVYFSSKAWSGNYVNINLSEQRMSIIPACGELFSYMNVSTQEMYNTFMTLAIGTLFPGNAEVTSLDWQSDITYNYVLDKEEKTYMQKAVYNTPFNCKLMNIEEREDGTIELDFCPNGEMPDAIEIVNADEKPGFQPIFSINGQRVGTTDANGNMPAALKQVKGIYVVNNKKFVIK